MRPGQHHVESGLSRAHRATMMNGYLRCACSASFQDLQLLLQEQRERKPSLLCAAHLPTVMNGRPSCPMQAAGGKLWGLYKWLVAKTDRLCQAPGKRRKRGAPPSCSLLMGHPCAHSHTPSALPFYSWMSTIPQVARLLPWPAFLLLRADEESHHPHTTAWIVSVAHHPPWMLAGAGEHTQCSHSFKSPGSV